MPMLPLGATKKRDVLPVMKLIDAFVAMLLMRYSCVTLLKPWNCAERAVLVVEQHAGIRRRRVAQVLHRQPRDRAVRVVNRTCSTSSGVVVPIPTAPSARGGRRLEDRRVPHIRRRSHTWRENSSCRATPPPPAGRLRRRHRERRVTAWPRRRSPDSAVGARRYAEAGRPPSVSASDAFSAYGTLAIRTRGCSTSPSALEQQAHPLRLARRKHLGRNPVRIARAQQQREAARRLLERDGLPLLPQRRAALRLRVDRQRDDLDRRRRLAVQPAGRRR